VAFTDLRPDELRAYAPALAGPDDLVSFWAATLAETRAHDLDARFTPIDTGLTVLESFDVSFAGFGGTRIRGWLHLPAGGSGDRLPAVVEFIGYGGGRGLAHERTLFAQAGHAHLVMDTRGQGSGWSVGDTPDPDPTGAPAQPGFLTRGILDPREHYYRRVYSDAVRAVEAVRAHPRVDPSRVAVTGGSQGGAITLAVAGLVPDLVGAAPDVPFLCDIERAIGIVDTEPYAELTRYLAAHRDHRATALETLRYVDAARLGRLATAPSLFSVGFMDDVCPPSTVFAAYHAYGGPKEIHEYPENGHEGGGPFHDRVKLAWLADRFGAD
jgi:cephalosporin-C deacetylase